jgi:hypothetical protein
MCGGEIAGDNAARPMKHPISNGRSGMTSETGRARAILMMISAAPTRMKN